jgi:hypothetical protein
MKSVLKSLIIVGGLFLAFAMGGCAQTHYSDGTKAGYCIGASCLVKAVLPAAALDVGRNPNGDFVRPSQDALKFGQSTYGQVISLMGQPTKVSEAKLNGKTVKIITYFYSATGGEPLEAGVIPARGLSYFFIADSFFNNSDPLVGQQYYSSFKSDNSNFDETKISSILKGKSTQAEVIQQLGTPSASFIAPMVDKPFAEAIEYRYQATRGETSKLFSKVLRIAFDDKGIASDVEYTSSGNK